MMKWPGKFFFKKAPVGYSIQGRKSSQQDDYYLSPATKNGYFIFVADGVGGHAHGDFASRTCREILSNSFESNKAFISDVEDYLRKNAMTVAESVWLKGSTEPEYKHCGTTLSGFLVRNSQYFWINIGDSRVYIMNLKNELRQLTKDHSIVQDLLDRGMISIEEALIHPQKNKMSSAIGQALNMIRIDVAGPYPIKRGDILLTCTDGIHSALSDNEISTIMSANKKNPNLAKLLVETAFKAGGRDNITACVYRH